MNTLASLHLRNIYIVVHVGGGQKSPRESGSRSKLRACARVTNYQLWTTQKIDTIPHPSMEEIKPCTLGSISTHNKNILIFKSF
jgi:hypothetical protein